MCGISGIDGDRGLCANADMGAEVGGIRVICFEGSVGEEGLEIL